LFTDPRQGNRYAYGADDPVNEVDPAGLLTSTFGACIGRGIAGCLSVSVDDNFNIGITPSIGIGLGGDVSTTLSPGGLSSGGFAGVGGCGGTWCGNVTVSNGGTTTTPAVGRGLGTGVFLTAGYTWVI
jgi:hypothetical protein